MAATSTLRLRVRGWVPDRRTAEAFFAEALSAPGATGATRVIGLDGVLVASPRTGRRGGSKPPRLVSRVQRGNANATT